MVRISRKCFGKSMMMAMAQSNGVRNGVGGIGEGTGGWGRLNRQTQMQAPILSSVDFTFVILREWRLRKLNVDFMFCPSIRVPCFTYLSIGEFKDAMICICGDTYMNQYPSWGVARDQVRCRCISILLSCLCFSKNVHVCLQHLLCRNFAHLIMQSHSRSCMQVRQWMMATDPRSSLDGYWPLVVVLSLIHVMAISAQAILCLFVFPRIVFVHMCARMSICVCVCLCSPARVWRGREITTKNTMFLTPAPPSSSCIYFSIWTEFWRRQGAATQSV